MKQTSLHDAHVALGALMSPFGGFDMPIQYVGIVEEHNAVRHNVGVFDVSHMGEVLITGPDATRFVNHIFTNDISELPAGKILYGMMLNAQGGTVDDLLVYGYGHNHLFLVINAGNIDKDVEWIRTQAKNYDVTIDHQSDSWSQLAVQGPNAEATMQNVLGIDGSDLTFYTFKELTLPCGTRAILSRTGYTGEDGFEIYSSHAAIGAMWQKLMEAGVQPCGLGCRDTLRFEAGLPLYGDELTDTITPIEAGLGIFVKIDKEGGFIGRDAVARQKADGVTRKLVGLEIDGQAIARHGYEVLNAEGDTVVGEITTGYHSISLDRNIAFALVQASVSAIDTPLQVRVRRKTFPARVVKKRFYTPNYKK
jgi:aminomethyltransferase